MGEKNWVQHSARKKADRGNLYQKKNSLLEKKR
jgi:hypothetical protein